jgi:putative hemolysin
MRLRRRRAAAAPVEPPQPSEQELQIRRGIESLREATAREVMTPRVDVVALAAPVRFSDVASAVRRSGHSHFPVYEGDLDHLLGVLFVKDLFHLDPVAGMGGARPSAAGAGAAGWPAGELEVTGRLREPYVVPESRPALELLAEMRKLRRAFAVVVDEYGGVAGVVTINDLVSELVGDLRDEFDRSVSPAIKRVDQLRFLVDGACGVDEVRSSLGAPIPEGEYVTLGGFLFDAFGHIPKEGEVLEREGWRYRVEEMDRRRVAKVVVQLPSATMSARDGEPR